MKLGSVLFVLLCEPLVVFSYANEDNVELSRYLLDAITTAPENSDCIDGDGTGFIPVAYPTYESLFVKSIPEGHVGSGWTAEEKRVAFESFLMDVPRLAQTNTVRDLRFLVETAFSFCDQRGATNVMQFAMGILGSSCRIGESSAADIFQERVVPSLAMNEFVGVAVSNRTSVVVADYLAADYADKLYDGIGGLDSSVITGGVSVLMRTLRGGFTAQGLDKILLAMEPAYSVSSNRLALAQWALRNQDEHPQFYENRVRQYFAPVTNQLLNAAQPLPEVEALRWL